MGGITTLRNLIRPLSRSILSSTSYTTTSLTTQPSSSLLHSILSPKQQPISPFTQSTLLLSRSIHLDSLSSLQTKPFDSLTDSRFPKRRPSLLSRRKRSSIRPSGPYAWVKHVEGEPVPPSQPNEGSVKLRNEKKRRRQKREFIKSEKKKRRAELKQANQRKREKRIERKMAAVARDREWAQRLSELQRAEQEKNKTAA